MSEYIVSARKYRPDTFKTVVGQEAITTTLKNSIKTKHLAHAYLFCGPRGVGKTTCARIFAKTINCFNPNENIEACNECDSCKGFNKSSSFNIHELDAASNNSVEGMRNLIDQVRIPPQIGKYNVYIIDEVHMLSSQAFNTFLKTLEEPPSHAIFILATTEKQKIIPTILSRCQIFDFNRIKISDISNHLQYVANNEKVTAEPEALNIIAQKADGAMRDALSIFDQIVSFCGSEVTYNKVIDTLNVLDYDYYFKITDYFISGNIPQSLFIFNEILSKGFEAQYFIIGLSQHFRNLLVCKDEITIQLLETGQSIALRYKNQSSILSVNFIFKAIDYCNQCDLDYRNSHNKRLLVELTLVKICSLSTNYKNYNEINSQNNVQVSEKASNYNVTPKENKVEPKTNETQATIENSLEKNKQVANISQKPRTISLSDALKPSEKKTSDISADTKKEEVKKNNTFDIETLKNCWLKFAETIKSDSRLYQYFNSNLPKIESENIIIVTVINNSQKDVITSIHDKLLFFLKRELENDFIKIQIEITEFEQNTNSKPYTDAEKYAFFLKNNPHIKTMRDQLNLDFNR